MLDPEERKLIIDLSKRGFLPKSLENEPAIVEAILEENMPPLQKRINSEQDPNNNESDSILGSSPTQPRLNNARSINNGSGNAGKTHNKVGSIDSQMGGSKMESLQQTPPTPEVIVNAPRFNKLSNNPLYHSTKDKPISSIKA